MENRHIETLAYGPPGFRQAAHPRGRPVVFADLREEWFGVHMETKAKTRRTWQLNIQSELLTAKRPRFH